MGLHEAGSADEKLGVGGFALIPDSSSPKNNAVGIVLNQRRYGGA